MTGAQDEEIASNPHNEDGSAKVTVPSVDADADEEESSRLVRHLYEGETVQSIHRHLERDKRAGSASLLEN